MEVSIVPKAGLHVDLSTSWPVWKHFWRNLTGWKACLNKSPLFIPDLLHGQDADSGGLSVEPWIQRAVGLWGGPGFLLDSPARPRESAAIRPLGW